MNPNLGTRGQNSQSTNLVRPDPDFPDNHFPRAPVIPMKARHTKRFWANSADRDALPCSLEPIVHLDNTRPSEYLPERAFLLESDKNPNTH